MFTLHFAPRTRAVRIRWLLEEAGNPYQLVSSTEAPRLVEDATELTESTAIVLWLADRFGLAPTPDAATRAAFLQWVVYAEATLEPAIATGATTASALLAAVDRHLDDRECLVGDTFTAADVVMASVLHRAHHGGALATFPRLLEYVKRHTGRPASRRAVSQ